MIAIGAGGWMSPWQWVAAPFYLVCPRVVKFNLIGRLKPWVSAKDRLILEVLRIFGTRGNVNRVFEYGGPG